ncbi:MAG: phosphatidylcholine/phosphatidylserine synthase [Pseudomonadota bacterium]
MILRRRQTDQIGHPREPSLWNRIIPHVITLGSLMLGLSAIRLAIEGNWPTAVVYIVLAGVLDGFDGVIARRMGVDGSFGAQLDSLVDFVSFGVAPALVLYWWSLQALGMIGWVICVSFAMCCGLRLARYHVTSVAADRPAWARGFFIGVPAPVGAGLVMVPMYVSFSSLGFETRPFGGDLLTPPWVAGWAVIVAMLFVSIIPSFSFRSIPLSKRMQVPALALFGGVLFITFAQPWLTLLGISALYLLSLPVSMWRWRSLAAGGHPMFSPTHDRNSR